MRVSVEGAEGREEGRKGTEGREGGSVKRRRRREEQGGGQAIHGWIGSMCVFGERERGDSVSMRRRCSGWRRREGH